MLESRTLLPLQNSRSNTNRQLAVAAGVSAGVESGILPGGKKGRQREMLDAHFGFGTQPEPLYGCLVMGLEPATRRRWLGGLMLLAALAMLIAGETVLEHRLSGAGFLLYWLLCLVFTGGAIMVAYMDVRAVQRKSRLEARELLEKTLHKIETDVRQKPRQSRPPEP